MGTLPRKVFVGFFCIFHQLIKGVEPFDLFFVDQIHKIDVRFVNRLRNTELESLLDCRHLEIPHLLTLV